MLNESYLDNTRQQFEMECAAFFYALGSIFFTFTLCSRPKVVWTFISIPFSNNYHFENQDMPLMK